MCQGADEEVCFIRREIGVMEKNGDVKVQKSWDAGLGEDDGEV